MITGLPIDGKPVIFERGPPTLTQEQVHELVGVDPKNNYVDTKELVEFINSLNEVEAADEVRINRTARAAALLGIGCMINPDLGKSRVHIFFLTHVPKLVAAVLKKTSNLMGSASFPLSKPCVAEMSQAEFFNGRNRPLVEDLRKIFYDLNPSEVFGSRIRIWCLTIPISNRAAKDRRKQKLQGIDARE
ncbi:hypothetical protein K1719_000053 [Acacia pycnantha]|nr:hypothetical protein K1719_000053 [Acacia pycnantha]